MTGQRTKLSTRDGNCGKKKLDTSLKPWKVTQKRLKFHISTTGLIVKEWPKLSHGRTARHSLARRTMRNDENQKEGKYSLDKIESYFTLFESLLAPKSNPLLAVEELCFAKQGSMNSGEFYAHVVKIAKRCKFPCAKVEERSIRDTVFLGMNRTKARDKAINLMNEEGKELTVDFLMQQLEIEDCNAHHKSLSQPDSTTSINFAACDHRQNKGKSNKKNQGNGKNQGQNNFGAQGSSNSSHQSRKPPGMEDKCMRCGKQEHQLGQRCPVKNAKCKDCHNIRHFHKVCQSKKRGKQRVNLVQTTQDDDDTHIDEN